MGYLTSFVKNGEKRPSVSYKIMGPLQLAVTWYKIRHAGEQAVHWDIQNKATSSRQICIFFVLNAPVRSLLSSMVDFVPCDRQLQRAHSRTKRRQESTQFLNDCQRKPLKQYRCMSDHTDVPLE